VVKYEYVTKVPGAENELMLALLTKEMAGLWMAGMVTDEGGEVTGLPEGGVPVAVAVLTMEPASRSAWVVR
jgi:hypothetical protein